MSNIIRERLSNLITRSERLFKTDMRYVAKGGFFLSISQVVGILGSLVTSLLFAHLTSQNTYGLYTYVFSLITIFSNLSLIGGIKVSTLQLSSHDEKGALRLAFWLNMATSVVVFVATLGGGLYYAHQGNVVLALGILIAGSLQPFISSTSLSNNYLNGRKDFFLMTLLSSFETLVTVVWIVAALLLHGGLIALVVAYSGSNLIGNVLSYWITVRQYPEAVAQGKHNYRAFFRLSSHVSVISIVKGIANNLDTVIIFHFMGAVPVAIYSFAVGLPEVFINMMNNALYSLALPRFAISFSDKNPLALADPVHERERVRKAVMHKVLLVFLVSIPITLLYIPLAPYAYLILFPKYAGSILYSQIFAPVIILGNVTSVFGSFQDSQANVRDKYWAAMPAAILRITLMLLLVRPFGIWGIIMSEYVARSTNGIVSYTLLRFYAR